MEKEEQLFRKRIQELAETCFRRDVPVNTDFLNLSEQTIFHSISGMLPPVRFVLSGGFESSERKVVCFLPSYEEELLDPPYDCMKLSPVNRKFAEELSHRDYLGAIMNLGIERSMLGDIVIKDGDAYVFVLKKMSRYLSENLTTIRHTTVSVEITEQAGEILKPEFEEIQGTVSSIRLDSIVALCGRLSRTKAAAYIEAEKVFVNGQIASQVSRNLKEGEILSIRGIGKFKFDRAGGQTKKGRTVVTLLKYK
ncbi:MAG: RNA-binding protein [Lachnospiraceae bacterium]|nr:RNA-binding protein [Lachnospiraceae bacterium]